MKASRTGRVVLLVLAAVVILAVSIPGQGVFPARLPDKGRNFGCLYCHYTKEGGGAFNSFGQDFMVNNFTYDSTLGAKDSDKDGFTNQQEFGASPVTNPGDPKSYPKADQPTDNNIVYFFLLAVVIAVIVGVVLVSSRGGDMESYGTGPKQRSKRDRRAMRRSRRGRKGRAGR